MSAALPEEESLSDEDQEEDEKLPTIDVKGHLFDLQYHPERFLLAASHIDGRVILYETARPEARENKLARTLTHHKKSCRSVSFHSNGDVLYTGSADCSIACVNVETGQAYSILADAHPKPVNCVRTYGDTLLGSGDDEGGIKIWDIRITNKQKPVMKWSQLDCADYISDMWPLEKTKKMLVTSGDGFLSVYDMRNGKLYALSENMDDELLSIAVLHNESEIVCGSRDGELNIFKYPYFGEVSDKFLGHPKSIDTMVVINNGAICTGSSDGLIRLLTIHPNKMVGVVGSHDDLPIERLAISGDKDVLASSSHDETIKLWDIRYLKEMEYSHEVQESEEEARDDEDDLNEDSDEDLCKSEPICSSASESDCEEKATKTAETRKRPLSPSLTSLERKKKIMLSSVSPSEIAVEVAPEAPSGPAVKVAALKASSSSVGQAAVLGASGNLTPQAILAARRASKQKGLLPAPPPVEEPGKGGQMKRKQKSKPKKTAVIKGNASATTAKGSFFSGL